LTHIGHSEKVLVMRIFLAVLVLIFSFQSWTKADDISDFQIEGMSIGDSLLDYYSKSEIMKKSKFVYRGGKKFKDYSGLRITKNLNNYDALVISFKTNDKKFIIMGIAGRKYYKKNVFECYDQQKIIVKEIEDNISNLKKELLPKKKVKAYPNGNSYITQVWLNPKDGGYIGIQCYDWSPMDNPSNKDRLSVVIFSAEYNYWLSTHKF
jgi:hypothetical protein